MQQQLYRICTKTFLDNIDDPYISFNENGVCKFFHEFTNKLKVRVLPKVKEKKNLIFRKKIKKAVNLKNYGCIIGVN